jgi:hypothetical protein
MSVHAHTRTHVRTIAEIFMLHGYSQETLNLNANGAMRPYIVISTRLFIVHTSYTCRQSSSRSGRGDGRSSISPRGQQPTSTPVRLAASSCAPNSPATYFAHQASASGRGVYQMRASKNQSPTCLHVHQHSSSLDCLQPKQHLHMSPTGLHVCLTTPSRPLPRSLFSCSLPS